MNSMHARRDNDQVQNTFDLNRQSPIRMVKQSRSLQCDEEDYQHHRVDSEERHSQRKKTDRKNHLAKMKSCGSAHVEIKIGMMHVMKPPEQGHHVIGPMPPPIGIIHQQECRDDTNPAAKG